jgi:hypothetical protein
MEYKISAIETLYGGVRFRSRLEAKWAAMFDILGWEWTYEPCDFSGWIPDFAIHGDRNLVYVEVKPVDRLPDDVAKQLHESGCSDEMLVVGLRPFEIDFQECPAIGWMTENNTGFQMGWDEAPFGRWKEGQGRVGFCHCEGLFYDRITGNYDGGHWGDGVVTVSEITGMWREAGNRTRWEKK